MRSKSAANSRPMGSFTDYQALLRQTAKASPRSERKLHAHLSLTFKWSLSIAALITIGMSLLAWVLINQQTSIQLHEMERFGTTVADQFAKTSSMPLLANNLPALEAIANQFLESPTILGIEIRRPDLTTLVQAGLSSFTEHTSPDAFREEKWIAWTWRENSRMQRHAASFYSPVNVQGNEVGYVLINLDRDFLEQKLRASIDTIKLTTLILIAATVAMAFVLGARLSRPIKHLAAAGEAIEKGEFNFRMPDRRRDEIGQIVEAFNRMAIGLFEKNQVEAALSRYVSPNVAKNILTNLDHISLGGEHVDGSVLFCDIVGYTELSEHLPPDQIVEILNEYFGYISRAGHCCQGMVDKFIGDCVMVVFGVPEKDENHGLHAISCAVLIQEVVSRLNEQRILQGQWPVEFRIGINSGQMLAGNMGADNFMQYTVVGDTVNLAARLCPMAEAGKIIVSQKTAEQEGVKEYVDLKEHLPISIRGRTKPVTPFTIASLNAPLQNHLDSMLEKVLPIAKKGINI